MTISDRRQQVSAAGITVDSYAADVGTAKDYYPFGMLMPGRKFTAGAAGYRYGFNGQENDNEVKGGGNQQDYAERIYDPRVSRFLSVDPLTQTYPWYTPYQFAGNTPLQAIDLDGSEPEYVFAHSRIQEKKRKMTPEQARAYEQNGNRVGMTYMYVTFLLPLDGMTGFNGHRIGTALFTTYSAMNVFEYTNRNSNQKDPNIRAQNENQVKGALVDMAVGYLSGKALDLGFKVFGQAGTMVLSKAERLQVFQKLLANTKAAGSQDEAIKLINSTLDKVEDAYSGVPKATGIPNSDDGRMYGILDSKFVKTLEDGTKVADTRGNKIILEKNGGFKIQSKDGKQTYFTKPGAKQE